MNKTILIAPFTNKLFPPQIPPCPNHCIEKLAPFIQPMKNAKQFQHWEALVALLRKDGNKIIQLSIKGEESISANEIIVEPNRKKIVKLLEETDFWMSIDSFLQHLNHGTIKKRGIVIWSRSSPVLFGYSYNYNILKNQQFLRPDQFGIWHVCPFIEDAFHNHWQIFELMKREKFIE